MDSNNKICVLYHYYEKNESYIENLFHFLNFGIWGNADYYFVIADGVCSLPVKSFANVNVVSIPNKNYDYGGFSQALDSVVAWQNYDYILFINSSVRGPYIPPHISHKYPWFDFFIERFEHDVGAVGASINHLPQGSKHFKNYEDFFGQSEQPLSHVQTSAYCLSNSSLACLIDKGFFNPNVNWERGELISKYEIRMSRLLVENRYKIKSLLPENNSIDFKEEKLPFRVNGMGDVFSEAAYHGRTIHPYEVIFMKSDRNLWPVSYLKLLSSSMEYGWKGGSATKLFKATKKEVEASRRWFLSKRFSVSRLTRKFKSLFLLDV